MLGPRPHAATPCHRTLEDVCLPEGALPPRDAGNRGPVPGPGEVSWVTRTTWGCSARPWREAVVLTRKDSEVAGKRASQKSVPLFFFFLIACTTTGETETPGRTHLPTGRGFF